MVVIAYYMEPIVGNNEEVKKTTIQVLVSTRDLLKSVGRKDETYDDLITRLVNFYLRHKDLADKEEGLAP